MVVTVVVTVYQNLPTLTDTHRHRGRENGAKVAVLQGLPVTLNQRVEGSSPSRSTKI